MSNKYQEALSKLEAIICELSCELKEDYELYTRDTGYEEHIETLQELVDRATPMKPPTIWEHADPKTRCSCSAGVIPAHNYCWNCGQKLDWSDDND